MITKKDYTDEKLTAKQYVNMALESMISIWREQQAGLLETESSRTAACDGIQFLSTSGTLTGKFSLYGVKT